MLRWGVPLATLGLAVGAAVVAAGCWGSDYRKVDGRADAGAGGDADSCEPFTLVPPTQCEGDRYLADGNNCCVPGRSCLGAGCDNGRCEARELAYTTQAGEAIDVILFGDDVLWSTGSDGEVLANSATGPASPRTVAEDPNGYATALTSDGTHIYWVEYEGSQIWRKDPREPQGTEQLVADTGSELGGFGRIVVHGEHVFWATAGLYETLSAGNSVWMAAKDGSESGAPTRIYNGGSPHGVAVDDAHVYWTDRADGASGVYRFPRSAIGTSADRELVSSAEGDVTDIAIVAGNLVWLDAGTVYTQSTDGGAIDELGSSGFGWSLGFDDVFVYWTDEYEDTVYRAALDGGGVVTQALAYGQGPKGLAVGCDALYFANHADNYPDADWVSKVAK